MLFESTKEQIISGCREKYIRNYVKRKYLNNSPIDKEFR